MVLFKEDITERRRAEEALRESEYWLKEPQRISQIGAYVLDVTSGILSTSWMSQTSLNTATTPFTQKGTPESAAPAPGMPLHSEGVEGILPVDCEAKMELSN